MTGQSSGPLADPAAGGVHVLDGSPLTNPLAYGRGWSLNENLTDPDVTSAEIEQTYIDIVKSVKKSVSIPVAVKISPYFSNLANMAKRLDQAGANALVLFNRFYQPDIDLEELEIRPNVLLSTPQALRLPLTWIGILYGRVQLVKSWFVRRWGLEAACAGCEPEPIT